jgi:hypothetical protein
MRTDGQTETTKLIRNFAKAPKNVWATTALRSCYLRDRVRTWNRKENAFMTCHERRKQRPSANKPKWPMSQRNRHWITPHQLHRSTVTEAKRFRMWCVISNFWLFAHMQGYLRLLTEIRIITIHIFSEAQQAWLIKSRFESRKRHSPVPESLVALTLQSGDSCTMGRYLSEMEYPLRFTSNWPMSLVLQK